MSLRAWSAILAALAVASPAAAVNYTWTAVGGGSFQSAANWTPSTGSPGSFDTAIFDANATYTVTFSGNVSTTGFLQTQGTVSLAIGAGNTYTVAGANSFTVGNVSGQTANLIVTSGTLSPTEANEGVPTGGIGVRSGSTGNLTVTGAGTVLTTPRYCDVGVAGTGTLTIQDNASVTMSMVPLIGYLAAGQGSVVVASGGTLSAPGGIVAGQSGTGSITINAGGSATVNAVNAGQLAGSFGAITVGDGIGPASLTVTNTSGFAVSLGVGIAGNGVLNVNTGGTLTSTGNASVANVAGATGMATIAGTWNQSGGSIFIGGQASGNPGGTGGVTVNAGGVVTVMGTGNAIRTYAGLGTLTINAGGTVTTPTLTNNGTFNLMGGTINTGTTTAGLVNTGVLTAGASSEVFGRVQNSVTGQVLNTGSGILTFHNDVTHTGEEVRTTAGGRTRFLAEISVTRPFTGPGTVEFAGRVRPGASAARVTFAGDLVFGPAATFHVELGGTMVGTQYDQLAVTGAANLSGTLDVVLINGFAPQQGQQFDILTYGSHTGDFGTFTGLDLGNGLALTPVVTGSTYSLVVTPVPEPGALVLLGVAAVGMIRVLPKRSAMDRGRET